MEQRANVELMSQTTFGKEAFQAPSCPPADAFPQESRAHSADLSTETVLDVFRE